MIKLNPSIKRKFAWILIFTMIFQVLQPVASYALTGGPSQPEVESFTPTSVSEMVNVSTGSFTYSIPLFEIGGYPVNLSYNSGISMDQEASSLGGLGWNINVGTIRRTMRGLPDDFNGSDKITKQFKISDDETWGGMAGINFELFGSDKIKLGASLEGSYNTKRGVAVGFGLTPSFSASKGSSSSLTTSLGLAANSASGVSFSPSVSFEANMKMKERGNADLGLSFGATINSRQGLTAMTLGGTVGISAFDTSKEKPEKHSRGLYNESASFSFSKPTYVPMINFPMKNTSLSISLTLGGALIGIHGSGNLVGYHSAQRLATDKMSLPAYGVLYAHNARRSITGLMDFNRENDGSFTENTPHLPIPSLTNDIYAVNGEGLGGSYKLQRSDVGIVFDNAMSNFGSGESFGGEIGGGNAFHGGADIVFNSNSSVSKRWEDANFDPLNFQSSNNQPDFEPAYFKMAGEKSLVDETFLSKMGGLKAVRVALDGSAGLNVKTQKKLVTYHNSNLAANLVGDVERSKRESRNQHISYMTGAEAHVYGLQKTIVHHKMNEFLNPATIHWSRYGSNDYRKGHHISEITTLSPEGMRYVFGLPVYNVTQKEVTFSVDRFTPDCSTGLVEYLPNQDNTLRNDRAVDNFFNEVTTPAYAHSFLLTAILSPDYVDRTGDGPTPDDFGNYTKFNYSKLYYDDHGRNYRWRIPCEQNRANYNPGFKTDTDDDQGSYTYGEKEIWLLHSIESRTQIAEYYYGNRQDGFGVKDENGGLDATMYQKKLERIEIYSKPDRIQNQSHATAIKKVFFKYNNDLCKGLPNANPGHGKLALEELVFTYDQSLKGKLSPYKFSYSAINHNYNIKSYNRWGTYKENMSSGNCFDEDEVSNGDDPYVNQLDRTTQDADASAWSLTEIQLPSGGKIKVNYEANDYAYVQDKKAMQMFNIVGARSVLPTSFTETTNNKENIYYSNTSCDYFVFKLQEKITNATQLEANRIIKRDYIGDIENGHLYFKAFVDLNGSGGYESVFGYAEIENYGAIEMSSGGDFQYGFVKMKPVCIKDKQKSSCDLINPITKAAWQFTRLNLPKIAYGQPSVTQPGLEQMAKATASLGKQLKQFLTGFNKQLHNSGYGKVIAKNKSWIRLYAPGQKKIAGGSRVNKITISDEWEAMAGGDYDTYEYGQEYKYTKEQTLPDGTVREISSGVAAYEPLIGGDENPLKQPIFFDETLLLAPDSRHYQEEPLGESFFPSPQIIYSRVEVRNLQHTGVKRTATGHIVKEFYTAKEYPTITRTTNPDMIPKKTNPILKFLKLKHKEYLTCSEGFYIENNDMHGKPKAEWIYDEGGTLISGVEYKYRSNNYVTVVEKDGSITPNKLIGVDFNMVADARESTSKMQSGGMNINVDGFLLGIFPGLAGMIFPSFHSEETRFRSIVTTKTAFRFGLLDETIAYDLGSKVSTKNLAYDAETGQVIATRTENEFGDPIFNFNIPAHMAYEGMNPAYQNVGTEIEGQFQGSGQFTLANSADIKFFTPGDELKFKNYYGNLIHAWVLWVNKSQGKIYLIGSSGSPLYSSGNINLKILRSGRRNQQMVSIGNVTSLDNPISGSHVNFSNKKVLNASSVEYSDAWNTLCGEIACTCHLKVEPNLSANLKDTLNEHLQNGTAPSYPHYKYFDLNSTLNNYLKAQYNCNWMGVQVRYHSAWVSNGGPCGGPALRLIFDVCEEYCELYLCGFPDPSDVPYTELSIENISSSTKNCDGSEFYYDLKRTSRTGMEVSTHKGVSECLKLSDCAVETCGSMPGVVVNPYKVGIKGNWRFKTNWTFKEKREQSLSENGQSVPTVNVRRDGILQDFSSFWQPGNDQWSRNESGWIWTNTVTQMDPYGNVIEELDILDRYSSEQLGYMNHLVTSVGTNTRNRQMVFDGFEDYHYNNMLNKNNPCPSRFFEFDPDLYLNWIASKEAHTGKYSLRLFAGNKAEVYYPIDGCDQNDHPQPPLTHSSEPQYFSNYKVQPCDCIDKFAPDPGKYVLSAWVKENTGNRVISYQGAEIEVEAAGGSTTFFPSGPIIDGWQRIYGEFDIPAASSEIKITLNSTSTDLIYFDDLRIHPFNAGVKSFVYDDVNLRFTYELDENNYYTKYEYDQSGRLERVKKETERGIMTIQETRFGQRKQ